jgi:hypothetical protein
VKAIGTIYLTWRKGKGSSRKRVGIIKKNVSNGVSFAYLLDGVKEAEKEGFTPYVDFHDVNKVYTENVLEIFGQRLIKTERPDVQKYLDFWAIDAKYKDDKFYLLAHTQGILSTDNFEFLAEFNPIKGLSFISEICGLSYTKIAPDFLEIGEELKWELDKKNKYDPNAVKVFKGDTYLGNVKFVHCIFFHKTGKQKLRIRVKSIEKNGQLNRAFINVCF